MTGCAPAAEATIADEPQLRFPTTGVARLPYRRGVNHVLVDLQDDAGRRYTFFVDTGATFSVVTPRFLERADAPARNAPPADPVFGAEGQVPGSGTLRDLVALRAGDLRIDRAGCVELDLSAVEEKLGAPVHGILGFNVLCRVTTAIDPTGGEVLFLDPARVSMTDLWGPPAHEVPFRLRMGAILEVTGRIDGSELPLLVDIGAQATYLNGPAEDLAGPSQVLSLGGLEFSGALLRSTDFPVFSTVGLGGRPAALLGNDLLGRQRMALDYHERRLLFWDGAGDRRRAPADGPGGEGGAADV